jgi:hypothetical protein
MALAHSRVFRPYARWIIAHRLLVVAVPDEMFTTRYIERE